MHSVELEWYFREYETECGYKSGHGAFVAQLQGVSTRGAESEAAQESDRALGAVKRGTPILAALRTLSGLQQRALAAYYLPRDCGKWDLVYVGGIAPVVWILSGESWPKLSEAAGKNAVAVLGAAHGAFALRWSVERKTQKAEARAAQRKALGL